MIDFVEFAIIAIPVCSTFGVLLLIFMVMIILTLRKAGTQINRNWRIVIWSVLVIVSLAAVIVPLVK